MYWKDGSLWSRATEGTEGARLTVRVLCASSRKWRCSIAQPPSRFQRAQRWARRRPALATSTVGGLVALVLASGLLVRRASDARAMERLAGARAQTGRFRLERVE